MKQKNINSKGLILKIDPTINEVMIISGEKFFYSQKTKQFEIDENPYGDAVCKPIQNVKITDDKLSLDTVLKNKEIQLLISSKFQADKIILPYLAGIIDNDFSFSTEHTDGIEIEFDKENLVRIIITRYENLVSKDFLTILLDNESSVITYPFQKFELKSIIMAENKFLFKTKYQSIEWELQMNSFTIQLIRQLMKLSDVVNPININL